jgi:hypothetical protein
VAAVHFSEVITVSKGLGAPQRQIKEVLAILWASRSPTRFDEIAVCLLLRHPGADDIWFERSARRALDGLLRRGDVVVVGGIGTSRSPRSFLCVEDFATLCSRRPPRTTAEAKVLAAEVFDSPIFAPTIPGVVQYARARRRRR